MYDPVGHSRRERACGHRRSNRTANRLTSQTRDLAHRCYASQEPNQCVCNVVEPVSCADWQQADDEGTRLLDMGRPGQLARANEGIRSAKPRVRSELARWLRTRHPLLHRRGARAARGARRARGAVRALAFRCSRAASHGRRAARSTCSDRPRCRSRSEAETDAAPRGQAVLAAERDTAASLAGTVPSAKAPGVRPRRHEAA